MASKSAGILLYRIKDKVLEVLLVHPGGPFWKNKDAGSWSIPKGEFDESEKPFDAALREMREEVGLELKGNFIELTPVKQKSGKLVYAWALGHDFDPSEIKSNTFEIEWPPKSGKKKEFPEIDRAEWYDVKTASKKIIAAQIGLLDELRKKLELE